MLFTEKAAYQAPGTVRPEASNSQIISSFNAQLEYPFPQQIDSPHDGLYPILDFDSFRAQSLNMTFLVNSVAWSPDSELVALGGDNSILIYNITTRTLVGNLTGHSRAVLSIAWNPTGSVIASGAEDGSIICWDVATENVVLNISRFGTIYSVAWSPDGSVLASGSPGFGTQLWNASSGAKIRSLLDYLSPVRSVAWSPDGDILAVGHEDGLIELWNMSNYSVIRNLGFNSYYHDGEISVAWSPDGTILAGATYSELKLWRTANWGEIFLDVEQIGVVGRPIAWSPVAQLLAMGSGMGSNIRILNVTKGEVITNCPLYAFSANTLAWSPDGRFLIAENSLWQINLDANYHEISVLYQEIKSLQWSPDGETLAYTDWNGGISFWTKSSSQTTRELSSELTSGLFTWNPEGNVIAMLGPENNSIFLWNVSNSAFIGRMIPKFDANITALAWSPGGVLLASGSKNGTITLWNMTSRTELLTLRSQSASVNALVWNPIRTILISSHNDSKIKFWNSTTGMEISTLLCHSSPAYSAEWHPEGSLVATGGNNTITIWNLTTGTAISNLTGDFGVVDSLTWHPSGEILISGAEDGSVRVWNTATGIEFCKPGYYYGRIKTVSWNPDGRSLAIESGVRHIKVIKVGSIFKFAEGTRAAILPETDLNMQKIAGSEIWYGWNGTPTVPLGNQTSIRAPKSEGLHFLHVTAQYYGTNFSRKYRFSIDKTAPIIALLLPENNTKLLAGGLFPIEIAVEDQNLLQLIINWNQSKNRTISASQSYRLELPRKYGSHILNVYAEDIPGNIEHLQFQFSIHQPNLTISKKKLPSVVFERETFLISMEVTNHEILPLSFGSYLWGTEETILEGNGSHIAINSDQTVTLNFTLKANYGGSHVLRFQLLGNEMAVLELKVVFNVLPYYLSPQVLGPTLVIITLLLCTFFVVRAVIKRYTLVRQRESFSEKKSSLDRLISSTMGYIIDWIPIRVNFEMPETFLRKKEAAKIVVRIYAGASGVIDTLAFHFNQKNVQVISEPELPICFNAGETLSLHYEVLPQSIGKLLLGPLLVKLKDYSWEIYSDSLELDVH